MWNNIVNWWKEVRDNGIRFPYAHDTQRKEASASLFFVYIAFYVAIVSIIVLHNKLELLTATVTAIGFFALCMVFYMLRKINKVKADLDDKSFELDNDEKEE